ncbi:MAG: hypothetical protein LBK66_03180 [Spirochaetaceae bacterium]|nr:hypothetical protein [Spirochaetaceae bacterium]
MDEFKLTLEKKQEITKDFRTDIETVNILERVYNDLPITEQYLAHVIRAMESYIRKTTGNQFFCIFCEPSLNGLGVGSAQYFHEKYFVIHIDPAMAEKDLRVYLAHELGHLFIIAIVNESLAPRERLDVNDNAEPLSSIFGIFTMADKNDFYRNNKKSPRQSRGVF